MRRRQHQALGPLRASADNEFKMKPTLVVGATGKVGRRVVEQLLTQNRPVRALVRNETKAKELFDGFNEYPPLEIIVSDLSRYDDHEETLETAVKGCSSVISVNGALRFSKLTDFLPWRLANSDVSSWADGSHPYYSNYLAQTFLIDMCKKHNVDRFVRLTGLSSGFSAFSFFTVLFGSLLSLTTRYHAMAENYLRQSGVPYAILRPGGLTSEEKDPKRTALQVDASGKLPPPARVGRSDVAAVAIAATDPNVLPKDKSYLLALQWVGEVKPKRQGRLKDGFPTARECLLQVAKSNHHMSPNQVPKMKPYGLAAGIFAYLVMGLSLEIVMIILTKLTEIFRMS